MDQDRVAVWWLWIASGRRGGVVVAEAGVGVGKEGKEKKGGKGGGSGVVFIKLYSTRGPLFGRMAQCEEL